MRSWGDGGRRCSAAFEIDTYGNGWPGESRIYHAPLDAIGSVTTPEATLDLGADSVQHLAVSATTVAAEIEPAGYIAVLDDGAVGRLGGASSAVPGIPQGVQVVGHQVLWEDWEDTVRIAHGSIDHEAAIYYAVAGTDLKSFATDGTDLMWLKAWDRQPGGHYNHVELWTSPYDADPTGLSLRKVSDLAENYLGTLGAGIFGMRLIAPVQRVELHDFADGRRRTFLIPGSCVVLENPLYVSATDMLLDIACPGHQTLFRVDPSALPYDP